MGTTAITNVYDGDTLLVSIYRQSDGYLSGHGSDIATILGGRKLVNGISNYSDHIVNGMGCAAAMLISELKTGEVGSIYINPPDEDSQEDYVYEIRGSTMEPSNGMTITVKDCTGYLYYDGPLENFDPDLIEDR
jgi:hypothetical protein